MLRTATTVPGAGVMKVNVAQTTKDLAELEYRREWLEATEWVPQVVRLNLAHTEGRVMKTIRTGLRLVQGILPDNTLLRSGLGSAIKWARSSVQKALETRQDREQTIADHEAQQAAGATSAAPPTGTAQGPGQGTVAIPQNPGNNPAAPQPVTAPKTAHLPRPHRSKKKTSG